MKLFNPKFVRPSLMIFTLMIGTLLPGDVLAHRIHVFAWLEGETVHTQSTANQGKPVVNGEISVYDQTGKKVLQGITDSKGEFSFSRPAPGALIIELTAGPGHKGVWKLEASTSTGKEAASHSHAPETPTINPQGSPENQKNIPLSAAQVSEIVDTSVTRAVAPLQEMVAAQIARRTGMGEILGGLGYILGLVGLGAYFHYRQKAAALDRKG
jgi:nickel transport protein